MWVRFACGALSEPSFSCTLVTDWFQTFPGSVLLSPRMTACPHHMGSDTLRCCPADWGRNSLIYMLEFHRQWQQLNPRSQFLEPCFLWAPNNKHGPTLSCSPLFPKTYQLIWGLEREFLVRGCLICPHGVKVTSGLCLWPDSLETAAATSRSWVGAGAQPGQCAVACTAFPRCWEPRFCRPDSQHMVFAKEMVPFPKCSFNRLYFSDHFNLKGGLAFTTTQKWPWGSLLEVL